MLTNEYSENSRIWPRCLVGGPNAAPFRDERGTVSAFRPLLSPLLDRFTVWACYSGNPQSLSQTLQYRALCTRHSVCAQLASGQLSRRKRRQYSDSTPPVGPKRLRLAL